MAGVRLNAPMIPGGGEKIQTFETREQFLE